MLLRDVDSAETALGILIEQFGHSLWSIRARIHLAFERGGIELARQCRKEILESTNDYYAQVAAQFTSMILEEQVSPRTYETSLQSYTYDPSNPGCALIEFSCTTNCVHSFSKDTEKQLLELAETFSLLDRFDVLSRILIQRFKARDFAVISDLACRLAEKFDVTSFKNICSISTNKPVEPSSSADRLFCALDHYTTGEYEACEEIATTGIKHFPLQFEFVELYCKSLIHQKKNLNWDDKDTLQHEIIEALFNIFDRNEHTKTSINKLLKLSTYFFPSGFQYQLAAFATSFSRSLNLEIVRNKIESDLQHIG